MAVNPYGFTHGEYLPTIIVGNLHEFTRAYIHAAFVTCMDETDENTGGNPLDWSHSPEELTPEARARMENDCAKFYTANREYIENGYTGLSRYSSQEYAGSDFWLTRNGHGAGFWDRGWESDNDGAWADEAGAILTRAAHAFGERSLFIGDDGRIYHYPA